LPKDIQILFHPFRYFVLYRIEEILKLHISKKQILLNPNGFHSLIDHHIEFFREWTTKKEFKEKFQKLNSITDLAISCEPLTFQQLFGFYSVQISHPYNKEKTQREHDRKIKKYFNEHKKILKEIGQEEITKIYSDLCIQVQSMERNIDIHRMLRFTDKDYRLKQVKGKLGGSMYVLTMAEMIRRAAEKVFQIELPEEDEIGFYFGVRSVKQRIYGSHRIIDDNDAKKEFTRSFGLDYNVRLRWYVEGDTEFGALNSFLGNHPFIELINLRGLVIAGGGKGLAFKEDLLNDIKTSVYSWVSLDGDRKDYIRILEKAVEADEMFGMFFISKPDFEIGNFTISELVEIVWELAIESGIDQKDKQKLIDATTSANSGKTFFDSAKKVIPYLIQIDKGKVWGEKLMRYADKHPNMKSSDGKKTERVIMRAIRCALHSYDCNYQMARKDAKVDIETGDIIYLEESK
jgi:hypothetical protein